MGERSRDSTRRGEQDVLREALRAAREGAGLTARELSLRLGAHHSYVSRIERGHRTVDVVEFVDLAEALGLDPRGLFGAFYARARGGSAGRQVAPSAPDEPRAREGDEPAEGRGG